MTTYTKIQLALPAAGASGDVLTRRQDGTAVWAAPTGGSGGVQLPGGVDGQVLTWSDRVGAWVPADPPAGGGTGTVGGVSVGTDSDGFTVLSVADTSGTTVSTDPDGYTVLSL